MISHSWMFAALGCGLAAVGAILQDQGADCALAWIVASINAAAAAFVMHHAGAL